MSMTPEKWAAKKKAKVNRSDKRIFLHIPYHPQNPSSGLIQQLRRDLIYLPPGKNTLNQLKNHFGHRVPVKSSIVAYRCDLNLANLNSYCKLSSCTGLKVSSFIWTLLLVSPYFFHIMPKRRHSVKTIWIFWYLNGVNLLYFLVCTPNSGTIKNQTATKNLKFDCENVTWAICSTSLEQV